MRTKVKSEKPKVKGFAFCLFTLVFFCSSSARAQEYEGAAQLFSPSVGRRFYEIAYELANSRNVSGPEAEQAIIFLTATANLDRRAKYVLPDIIKVINRHSYRDHSELMYNLLDNYINESADLEVISTAVRYLLERLNSREEREKLLEELLQKQGGKNAGMNSELATLLGLLRAEKADWQAAKFQFMQAYDKNKYNKLAFEKLAELVPEQISPAMYLEQLRLELGANPLNIETALAFAQYAERLQLYETAADAYRYCADLFGFLYPSHPLPAYIYLPWALSSYNTQRNQHRCLQIAERIRQTQRFDLFLEAIAGKAAAKIGHAQQANRVFQAAEKKAQQLFADDSYSSPLAGVVAEQLAWFYCFAAPDADKAVDWANRAYSIDPDSAAAASVLAYALVMNGQNDWAGLLIDNYQTNQIAALATAQIQLAAQQQSSAIQTLKSVIDQDPGSLEAEHAKELLVRQGAEYLPPVDPGVILMALRGSFESSLAGTVPSFVSPEKMISVQFNVRGSKFSYGSELGGVVVIVNNSLEPLVVSDDSLFRGNIRVDASISGDINKKIPNLVSLRIRPSVPVKPGRSILVPLRLVTAELRRILLSYPQASLDIEFTVYIDPVTTDRGNPTNALPSIKPATLVVKRPGTKLSGKFLQNRLDSLSKGRQGQKIKIVQLFTGLLTEQHAMANREPLYKFTYADWMPGLLKSALLSSLTDDDWVVKVQAMAGTLSLPLDYEMISAAAENLSDTHWPARLMAIYLLAKTTDNNFAKVLDYTAKYDSNKLVREMAIALGAVNPEVEQATKQVSRSNSRQGELYP